jgi:hypothetical protein
MKKAKVHRFWITSTSSVGTSDYKLFVSKADYERAMKRVKELEALIK